MSFKSFCVIPIAALLMQFAINATAQEKESQWIGVKPVAKKVVIEPMVPKRETRGEVKYTEYELVWPSIETHKRSLVTVTGKNVRWTQEFVDGDAPVFNAIEEKFDAGNYTFRVDYIANEAGQARQEREESRANRRELLKKRLELLEKGDRDGAKRAFEKANQIRSIQVEKSKSERARSSDRKKDSGSITRTGKFVVNEDGEVEAFRVHREPTPSEKRSGSEQNENSKEASPYEKH